MAYRFRIGEMLLSREMTKRGRREWVWVKVVARHRDGTYSLDYDGHPIKRQEGDLKLQCQLAI